MVQKTPSTTTQVQTSTLPSYVQPYVTDLLNKAQTASNLPYTPNPNQQVADPTAATNQANQMVQGIAGAGVPSAITNAQGVASGIAGGVAPGVADAQSALQGAASYRPQDIASADLSKYMSPYAQQVIDVQKQQAQQDYGEQQNARDASAVQAGAFGGDRATVANAIAQEQLNRNLQGIEATGLNTSYNNAVNEFQTQQNQNLQGAQLGVTAASDLGNLGINAANSRLNAANAEGNLGQMANTVGLQNAAALSGVGAQQQQQQQNVLNATNAAWNKQTNWPATQASLYASLLNGTYKPDTTASTTTPPPSLLSQIGGLATAGIGAVGAFGGL